MKALSKEAKFTTILSALGTAAASDRTSKVIDTKGFRSCCIFIQVGSMAASSSNTFKVQRALAASDADTLTSGADIAGTAQTAGATDDDELYYIDFPVLDDAERYLQLVVDKDGTNATDESAQCILYNPEISPTTHGDGTSTIGEGAEPVNGETHYSLAEGTA